MTGCPYPRKLADGSRHPCGSWLVVGHADTEEVTQQTNNRSIVFYTERVGRASFGARGMRREPPGMNMLKQQVGSQRREDRERGACWLKPLLGTRTLPSKPPWVFEWLGVEQAGMSFVETHHDVLLHR